MRTKINKDRVIELLEAGWEMGSSQGHIWLQQKLMCGGESYSVNGNAYTALKKAGIIESAPRLKNDPFWLARLRLVKK